MDYFISFLNCSRSHPNSGIDYLGFYNEVGGIASVEWTVAMRRRMDGEQYPCSHFECIRYFVTRKSALRKRNQRFPGGLLTDRCE